ncbi:Fe-S cluster assembly protein SufD [Candidatus Erwinia haradaeae]|uniref:FeS cluster assembly protein SufD n=1 Tax=Candidatus Erwinia haradaeae TaxID=1922217 RepID=A0A451DAB8_9GAMM|nr:Fe-S cluster assembly protein SufD [Candidatus Erwinia haradaeae]VFP83292.1 FeS cluster assembly protein SufD [Candidatus Erwinia haradaeae]
MVGLLTKSEYILQKWKYIVQHRNKKRNIQDNESWMEVLRLGLPTTKQSEWRCTPLDRILDHNFATPLSVKLSVDIVQERAFRIDAVRLVFVDGLFSPELSDQKYDPFSIHILSPESSQIRWRAPVHPDVFVHLTESLAGEITFIHISREQKAIRPLYLLHITTGGASDKLYTAGYRHHLQQDTASEVTVIEHYITLNNLPHFTAARFTADINNASTLKHYYLAFENHSSYHVSHNDFNLGACARAESHSFLLGAGVTFHQTSSQCQGEGSNLMVNSLMFPIGTEVCENRTWVDHIKGLCHSHQLHKTIVCDHARAIFNGMIKVRKDANKTYGQMNNRNLLLGSYAAVDSQPQLEIYNDDVKCGHEATVECLNEEQIFYLRSRGVHNNIARRIIINAFLAELTELIPDVILKNTIIQRINNRFLGGV